MPFLNDASRQLRALAELEDDWDACGAKHVRPETIVEADHLIAQVAAQHGIAPSDIYPMNSGAIQVEWLGADTLFVVAVNGGALFRYLLVTGSGTERRAVEKADVTLDEAIRVAADIANA